MAKLSVVRKQKLHKQGRIDVREHAQADQDVLFEFNDDLHTEAGRLGLYTELG